MRGSPLLRLLIAVFFLAAAGLGTALLTASPSPDVVQAPHGDPAAPTPPTRLRILVESPLPLSVFRMRNGDEILFDLQEPGMSFEASTEFPAASGADFLLEAQWAGKEGQPVALRVRSYWNEKDQGASIFWGEERILDVLSLPRSGPTP